MNEAEMTLHHLGPDEFSRRVNCYPVETVCPHRITEKSRVIGSWSLNREKYKRITEKKPVKFKQCFTLDYT